MKIREVSVPRIFLDMDGVIADLYNYAASIHDVDHYNAMTDGEWEIFFSNSDAYHLFRDIPVFTVADTIINLITRYTGKYYILSSPLRFDRAGSIKGKREWINNHVKIPPAGIIFEHDKFKYATNPDGTPNILIDDYRVNITKWENAGGIGIKFQADEDPVSKIKTTLDQVFSDK